MEPISLSLVEPFTKAPRAYSPGELADARNEHDGDLLERAGTMILRYIQGSDEEARLSTIAGMLAERYPFHKQPLAFFQKATDQLVASKRLLQEGDFLALPGQLMTLRIASAWLHRKGAISKTMVLSQVNETIQHLKEVTTSIVALHGAIQDRSIQAATDQAWSQKVAPELKRLDGTLRDIKSKTLDPAMRNINPGLSSTISREKHDLMRNFR